MTKRIAGVATFVMVFMALPVGTAAQTTVVRADRMLDVVSGQVVSGAVVVIEGDRIVSVGGNVPDGADVIDLGDVTLVPGLTDLHTHLTGDIEGDWTNQATRETDADAALRGARNAKRTLYAGFTTVRDMSGFAGIALMRAIDKDFVEGPRIFPGANSLGITGGHCDVTGFAPGILETDFADGVGDGPSGVLRAARYQIKHGARFIKICATAGVLSFEGPVGAQQFTFEEMRTIVEEAARHGTHVAAHAHGTEGINTAVRAGVRSIEHGSMLTDESISLMKEHGTYLVPTTYLAGAIDLDALPASIRAKAETVLPLAIASVEKAIREGVNIAFGTDAAVFPHGDNAREFAALVERGMDPLAALRSATLTPAELLGFDDRGQIAPGFLADIIAVPGNPLENIRVMEDVQFVMKGGVVYKRPHP
ncbi:MAG: amidohydrolase family protein [Gemmatimonadetes bacterium]|nr:amidohydrolase family protein [Gemmatimonadota bacterium]